MQVNNFDEVRSHLVFDDPSKFYFAQIVKRSKDNPNMTRYLEVVKSFYIFSLSDYDRYKSKIISLCNQYNARCCINMNKLSMQDIGALAKDMIDTYNSRGSAWYKKLQHVMDTACVSYSCSNKTNEFFIVDIDEHGKVDLISDYVKSLGLYVFSVPTVNGDHIVIKHYDDRKEFFKKFNDINVDIMTYCQVLLYSNVRSTSAST